MYLYIFVYQVSSRSDHFLQRYNFCGKHVLRMTSYPPFWKSYPSQFKLEGSANSILPYDKPHVSTICSSGGEVITKFREKIQMAARPYWIFAQCENNIIWVCTPGGIFVLDFNKIEPLWKIDNYDVVAAILVFFSLKNDNSIKSLRTSISSLRSQNRVSHHSA